MTLSSKMRQTFKDAALSTLRGLKWRDLWCCKIRFDHKPKPDWQENAALSSNECTVGSQHPYWSTSFRGKIAPAHSFVMRKLEKDTNKSSRGMDGKSWQKSAFQTICELTSSKYKPAKSSHTLQARIVEPRRTLRHVVVFNDMFVYARVRWM